MNLDSTIEKVKFPDKKKLEEFWKKRIRCGMQKCKITLGKNRWSKIFVQIGNGTTAPACLGG